jgi:hypothetical protein
MRERVLKRAAELIAQEPVCQQAGFMQACIADLRLLLIQSERKA